MHFTNVLQMKTSSMQEKKFKLKRKESFKEMKIERNKLVES